MLLGGGALAVFGSEKIGFEGAGPLGVVFAAFVSNYYWCQQGTIKYSFLFLLPNYYFENLNSRMGNRR